MIFKKIFGGGDKSPAPAKRPRNAAAAPAEHPLEQAIFGLVEQDKAHAAAAAAREAHHDKVQRINAEDFGKLCDTAIHAVFEETVALFQKHGSRVHIGKAGDEKWNGESARLNLYSRAEYKGPFITFSLPDPRKRDVRVTRTVIESVTVDVPMDDVTPERVRAEIAKLVEDVRKHRQKTSHIQ